MLAASKHMAQHVLGQARGLTKFPARLEASAGELLDLVSVVRDPSKALRDCQPAAEVLGNAVEIRVPHLRTGETAVVIELSDEFHPDVGELVPWRCAIGALLYSF